jgi:phenylalanyl-tRNA synthetase beta chain
MEIAQATVAFEIFLDNLDYREQTKHFLTSNYQAVVRDFAFVMDKAVSAQILLYAVRSSDEAGLIKKISLFDIFQSDELGSNKKSLAIKVVLQAPDHTLTTEEISKFSDAVISSVLTKIQGATLRT